MPPFGYGAGRDVPPAPWSAARCLKEFPELLGSETGILGDTAHRQRVDGVVPRNRDDPGAVGHDDVLALANDPEVCLLECSNCAEMIDARDSRHDSDRDLDFPNLLTLEKIINSPEVFPNRVLNIHQSFFLGRSLRPAAGKPGDGYAESLVGLLNRDLVFHLSEYTSDR